MTQYHTLTTYPILIPTNTTLWLPSFGPILPCTHQVGHIDKVIMGLDKNNNTPCGFCFVIYYTRGESERCVKYINGTVLDDRIVRVDHDWGFQEGRQWGRGRSGGQVGAAGQNTGPCEQKCLRMQVVRLRITNAYLYMDTLPRYSCACRYEMSSGRTLTASAEAGASSRRMRSRPSTAQAWTRA